jgi:hypothetical protein
MILWKNYALCVNANEYLALQRNLPSYTAAAEVCVCVYAPCWVHIVIIIMFCLVRVESVRYLRM